MNKKQKQQYKKEFQILCAEMDNQYPGCLDDKKLMKRLEQTAKMAVLKNTIPYRIKRFFIFLAGRVRQKRDNK